MKKVAITLNILVMLFCVLNIIKTGVPKNVGAGVVVLVVFIIIPIINIIALATSESRKKKIEALEKEGTE